MGPLLFSVEVEGSVPVRAAAGRVWYLRRGGGGGGVLAPPLGKPQPGGGKGFQGRGKGAPGVANNPLC